MAPRSLRIIAGLMLLAAASPAAALEAGDFRVHGLLDVALAERGRAFDLNVLTRGDSPFDAYSLRLNVDATINGNTQVFTQLVLRDASGIYLDGAYVSYRPITGFDLNVLGGKIPWAVGTWAPRTYSNVNPLIGTPLMYQYHSSLVWYAIPPDADALLSAAGTGQSAVDYFGFPMSRGMPMVDDSYWDIGATVTGSARPLEYALGFVTGTPGWGSTSQDENAGKSVLGRIGFAPVPSVRIGFSGAYGPYLNDSQNPSLPPGTRATDYHQILGMADAELLVGHVEARAEAARNVWETPTVGDLEVTGGYAELKYAFGFGGFIAGRWDVLDFGDITDSSGNRRSWDYDVERIEAGVGYRFDRSAVGKIVVQRTELDDPAYSEYSLVAAQISLKF